MEDNQENVPSTPDAVSQDAASQDAPKEELSASAASQDASKEEITSSADVTVDDLSGKSEESQETTDNTVNEPREKVDGFVELGENEQTERPDGGNATSVTGQKKEEGMSMMFAAYMRCGNHSCMYQEGRRF